jgi:hypothetical protein
MSLVSLHPLLLIDQRTTAAVAMNRSPLQSDRHSPLSCAIA